MYSSRLFIIQSTQNIDQKVALVPGDKPSQAGWGGIAVTAQEKSCGKIAVKHGKNAVSYLGGMEHPDGLNGRVRRSPGLSQPTGLHGSTSPIHYSMWGFAGRAEAAYQSP